MASIKTLSGQLRLLGPRSHVLDAIDLFFTGQWRERVKHADVDLQRIVEKVRFVVHGVHPRTVARVVPVEMPPSTNSVWPVT